MTDENGTILTWNKDYKPEEAIGQNYRILFPEFLKEEGMPEKEIGLARENGRYETENWRRAKGGELFWAYVVLTKITDENGKLAGYVKITQDETVHGTVSKLKNNYFSKDLKASQVQCPDYKQQQEVQRQQLRMHAIPAI